MLLDRDSLNSALGLYTENSGNQWGAIPGFLYRISRITMSNTNVSVLCLKLGCQTFQSINCSQQYCWLGLGLNPAGGRISVAVLVANLAMLNL